MENRYTSEQELSCELTELRRTNAELEERLKNTLQRYEELKKAAERLEMALDGAEVGVWDYNLRTGEAFVNPPTLPRW